MVLLTSDFHMYRAIRVFRKLDIEVTPMAAPDVLHSTENWNGRSSGRVEKPFMSYATSCALRK